MSEEKKRGIIFFINCKDEEMIYNLMSERNLSQGFLSTIRESLDRTRHGESVVFLNLDENSELNIGSYLQSPLNKVVLIDVDEDDYIHSYRCFTTNFSLYTLKLAGAPYPPCQSPPCQVPTGLKKNLLT